MQEYVSLRINGSRITAPKGTSVLDAALGHGICIPHLCHVPGLTDFGGCRLCIVEIVRNGRSRITTSCTLEVQQDMVVRSDTDRVRRYRKNIAELLVAEAPNSRAIQDLAVRCGVEKVRYPFRNEKCVLCGRCVRVCEEMWQARAIGFVGRGKKRHVDFPLGVRPDFCKKCGTCVDLCPMTITPCAGPMKAGEETLCSKCASQLSMTLKMPDHCVQCDLGRGFGCERAAHL